MRITHFIFLPQEWLWSGKQGGGHTFQLNFTNARGLMATDYIPNNTANWTDGEFRFGFVISRLFTLMIKNVVLLVFIFSIFMLNVAFDSEREVIEPEQSVNALLLSLGDEGLPHQMDHTIKGVSAERGEQIIKYGFTTNNKGNKVRKQSKHFVCTSCHNLQREDSDLSVSDPEARLRYAIENDLPFLQGTSLYGAVNRTSFYNDDYYKKYGALVDEARNDIRNAIQLCATECAQGRL